MTTPKPNVVSREAAAVARAYVFEQRDTDGIDPREVVARILDAGHGNDIPPEVRKKRLRTWALQVLRRLKKRGWLDEPGPEGWPPTAVLRSSPNARRLAKNAPRQRTTRTPATPSSRPARPTPPPAPAPRSVPSPRPPAPPPESWEGFIQDWVFSHRHSDFGVAEIAVAIVQRGFGTGDIGGRLDGARDIVENTLPTLQLDGLIRYDEKTEFWKPTDLLRSWPAADDT